MCRTVKLGTRVSLPNRFDHINSLPVDERLGSDRK